MANGLLQIVLGWSSRSPENRGCLAGVGISGVLIAGMQLPAASPLRVIVLGEPAIQAVVQIDGELILDQESTGLVKLQNRSGQPAKIIGIARSCRCFDLVEDPVTKIIRANEQVSLPLAIKPNKFGLFHQRVEVYLDHPQQLRMNVDVVGYVQGAKR
jgi:hypothetical protein